MSMTEVAEAYGNAKPLVADARLWWEPPYPDYSFEEWLAEAEGYLIVRDVTQFKLGDMLIWAEERFPDIYAQLVSQRHAETCRKAIWVCSKIPHDRRREGISFSIHDAVASLSVEEQEEFFALVQYKDWDRQRVRDEIRRRHPELSRRKIDVSAPAHTNGHVAEPEIIPPPQAGLVKKHEAGPTATKIIEAEPEPPGTRLHLNLPKPEPTPYDSTQPPKSFGRPTDEAATFLYGMARPQHAGADLKRHVYALLAERQELLEQIVG